MEVSLFPLFPAPGCIETWFALNVSFLNVGTLSIAILSFQTHIKTQAESQQGQTGYFSLTVAHLIHVCCHSSYFFLSCINSATIHSLWSSWALITNYQISVADRCSLCLQNTCMYTSRYTEQYVCSDIAFTELNHIFLCKDEHSVLFPCQTCTDPAPVNTVSWISPGPDIT